MRDAVPTRPTRARALFAAALVACALGVAACGGDDTETTASSGDGAGAPAATTKVRLALDWVPNSNHAGFFLAQVDGLYEKQGIDFEVIPYSNAPSDTVVSAGKAECGITAPPFASISASKGAAQQIVMPVVQKPLGSLAVLESSKYQRPSDLDGATYGGFGSAGDEALVRSLIRADGGKGDFKYVNLTTATTEALFANKVDFVNAYVNSEPVEAELRDKPLRVFPYTKFGIPEYPGVVVICNPDWLSENADAAKRFVAASAAGWEAAQADPQKAADALISENPGGFANDRAKVAPLKSLELMKREGLLVNGDGHAGCLQIDQLTALGEKLTEIGFYREAKVEKVPDFTTLATDEYQPPSCQE